MNPTTKPILKAPDDSAIKPPRKITLFWQAIVLQVLKGATKTVRGMPRSRALRFGASLGHFAHRIDRRRSEYAKRNLRLAFGDSLSQAERDTLIRETFEHWGICLIEFLRGGALDAAQMDDLVAEVEGREYLDAARAREGGLIFVTGHIGNFEFLGRWMASQGVPSTVIARDPAAPALAAYLREMREYGGNVALPKGPASVRALLTLLKRGGAATLGVDQSSGDLFIPFFGVPAGTVSGPAVMVQRTGALLIPAFCVMEPDSRYRMIFLPPVVPANTGDKEADIALTMTAINEVLECVIRRFPAQWLWLHNRWKSAFQEKNRARWPEGGIRFDEAKQRWLG